MTTPNETRRRLLLAGSVGLTANVLAARAQAVPVPAAAAIDAGTVTDGRVRFPQIHADSERPDAQPPAPDAPDRRVGFAVMGLGRLALDNILPAFARSDHARPVALISGDAAKMRTVAAQHGIDAAHCYGYDDFARIRDDAGIEAIYVVLPNGLHRDAVVQAARAGKHVLCEKPMANTADEARAMIDACRRAQRLLMIAYRCQYEPVNRELARRVRAGEFGDVQLIDAINTQNQGDPSQWRHNAKLAGGGALPDVGLYCLNTTRALLGEEPVEVSAAIRNPPNDPRFTEVESNVAFTLRFPSGVIANCATSYSAHEHRNLRVLGTKATGEIENAFAYEGQRLHIARRAGRANENSELALPVKDQFALELDHFATCIRSGTQPRTPGEEGLQDQIVMAAIYEAARTGKTVRLPLERRIDAFRGPEPAEAS